MQKPLNFFACGLLGTAGLFLAGCGGKYGGLLKSPSPTSAPGAASAPSSAPATNPVAPVASPAPITNSPVYAYPSRSMEEYRNRVGKRIMDSNAQRTFLGKPPSPLASVPVMSITLNGDGSVKNIEIQRVPKFYPEMTEVARAAILRAGPFERIAHLPQPWTFSETFLFNDDLKFQLHSQQPN